MRATNINHKKKKQGCVTKFTDLLTEKHGYVILAYLLEHGETKQSDFHGIICKNYQVIKRKLKILKGFGLVTERLRECEDSRHLASYWALTDMGREVCEQLAVAEEIFEGHMDLETDSIEEAPKER